MTSWRRGFWSLIATQFLGAFNDNALKGLVVFLILGSGFPLERRNILIALVGVLFTLPFILFAMVGGYVSDRYSKRSVTIAVKVLEIAIMGVALAGFAFESLPVLIGAVFLMGVHSSFFAPSKYGLLPELLPRDRLSWGNGILEMGTMTAIITGTVLAGILSEVFRGRHIISGSILVALSIAGLATSIGITRVAPADPGRRLRIDPFRELAEQLRPARSDRVLGLAIAGWAYFWFLGALLQFTLVAYGKDVLAVGETRTSLLQVAVALGIGAGSLAAGSLSGRKIEYGFIPLGSLGLTVFGAMLALPGFSYGGALALLSAMGFFSGFFLVPVGALIQHRPPDARKGGVIAASNLFSSLGLAAGFALSWAAAAGLGLTPRGLFGLSAILTVGVTVYVLWLLPDALLRFLLWLLVHTIYRLRVVRREHLPARGGALLVSNHVSFVDALLLLSSTDRRVRFLIDKGLYDCWWLRPFARLMRAIPVSSSMRPRELVAALREAADAVRAGRVVAIFAEGQITRTGGLLPFARGLERIMKGQEAPIVPVALEGVWGSLFSFSGHRFFWKRPERIPYPVSVVFGAPLAPGSSAAEVRRAVQELQSEAWVHRQEWGRTRMPTLARAFVRTARRHRRRMAMADAATPAVRYGAALARAVYLARRLRGVWEGQEMVGILLPPSVGGALVNHAAFLLGKVPVNLNYTLPSDGLASCVKQCALGSVVTSRVFLEKAGIAPPARAIYIEDVAATPRRLEKLAALAIASALPARLIGRALGADRRAALDDLATIIFSSGSTGQPKGVKLSHFNIVANAMQIGQIFGLGRSDRVVGVLPFFHSFGFTVTLAMPAVLEIGAVYHFTPLDPMAVGAITARYAATFLPTTPTLLQLYMRRTPPETFGSLRFIIAGAEKLPERVATAFEERFGIRPHEGYGCTECAPVVAVNAEGYRAAGFRQVGARRGTIGHPLPGVSVRIVDPETGAPLDAGREGVLWVRGPNVMQGYLGRPDLDAEVLRDGWYVTGDVARIDEDGFVTITDRLSRFSKIGGEMVPHVRIEEALQEMAGETQSVFAVTALPDPRKGERLVVLTTLAPDRLTSVLGTLATSGLPNLWRPRPDLFFRVDALPVLGTGKLDLRRLREMAAALAGAATGST